MFEPAADGPNVRSAISPASITNATEARLETLQPTTADTRAA
jgi:hypothetical protein